MALNKYMHPRNPYKKRKPDFQILASKYDYFKEKVTVNDSGKVILDFKDPAALRALTRALLEADFGLIVTMPLDRLIPTVPQRLNYILWLEDIIGKENGAKGIDIGTGSSCIYPLLGCRLNQWKFLASEIDDQNMYFARKNVASNKMEDHITIKKVTDDTLLIGLVNDDETYEFCMCNPPFYSDHLEAQGITSSRNDNRSESSSISTASESESIAWGGEVRFVTQMIEESLILKDKVRLYTSLLGKKMSLLSLKDVMHKKKVPKYSSTEFCQGRTMRWGIAWTFDESLEFPKSSFREQKNVKPPLQFEVPRSSADVVGDYTVQAHSWYLMKQLENLKIRFYIKHNGKFYSYFIIQAKENTWSHQRRKRRQQRHSECQNEEKQQSECQNEEKQQSECQDEEKQQSECQDEEKQQSECQDEEKQQSECQDEEKQQSECQDEEKQLSECQNEEKIVTCEKRNSVEKNTEVSKNAPGNADSDTDNVKSSTVKAIDGSDKLECRDNESVNGRRKISEEYSDINAKKMKSEQNTESINMTDAANIPEADGKAETESSDTNRLVRKEVIEQFWKEKQINSDKKREKSFYETLEPFDEKEECLLLSKLIVRKEEGKITFSMTCIAGNREAMHQIFQFYKNKLCPCKK